MKTTKKPWDGSAARFGDPQKYCASCLIDENADGEAKAAANCHLPVREPDGTVNENGVAAAAARLSQVKVSPASKAKAARKLTALHARMGKDVPASVKQAMR